MQREYQELQTRKIGLVAISYDSPEILKEFAARKNITFPLLSDAGSKTIKEYGIFNDAVKPDTFAYGVPKPGTLVLDHAGKIIAKYAEDDYRERVTITSILNHQTGTPVTGSTTEVNAKRMKVKLGASEKDVFSGQRLTLSIEGDLPAKMHVYAPGVTGYKPVSWTLEDSPAWKSFDTEFPKPEMLRLEVIKETVPAYRNKFVLQRDVTLGNAKAVQPLVDANGDITVKGTFRFQACDDKECYLPESLPVEWKLHWEPYDSQRSSEGIRHK